MQDSVSYPLVSGGSNWRHFRAGLCEFMSLLVHSCRNSLLYDDYVFSSLIALLTGLADSQVRAFRHTSTLIGEFGFISTCYCSNCPANGVWMYVCVYVRV